MIKLRLFGGLLNCCLCGKILCGGEAAVLVQKSYLLTRITDEPENWQVVSLSIQYDPPGLKTQIGRLEDYPGGAQQSTWASPPHCLHFAVWQAIIQLGDEAESPYPHSLQIWQPGMCHWASAWDYALSSEHDIE